MYVWSEGFNGFLSYFYLSCFCCLLHQKRKGKGGWEKKVGMVRSKSKNEVNQPKATWNEGCRRWGVEALKIGDDNGIKKAFGDS